MRITQISVYSIKLPFSHPFRLSGGRLVESLDSTIIAIDTDAGIRGWGEGCPWGTAYAPAFSLGLRAGIEEIAPSLIGLDPRRTDVVYRAMDVLLCGHPYVKSALDMACWDILGKTAGFPICDLLGGRVDQKIPLKTSVSMGTPDEMNKLPRRKRTGYLLTARFPHRVFLNAPQAAGNWTQRDSIDCLGTGKRIHHS